MKTLSRFILGLLMWWVIISGAVRMAHGSVTTYYVATNGLSSNSGSSPSSPWPIDYAQTHVSSSTNIIIALDGTYVGYDPLIIRSNFTTLLASNKWGARLVGSTIADPEVSIFPNTVHDVTVDGFEIADAGWQGVEIFGSNDVVRNCWIHDCGQNHGATGTGSGIFTFHPQNNTLIERNLIENNGFSLGFDHGIYASGTNCIIRNNVCRGNAGGGISIYTDFGGASTGCQVYNNLLYNNVGFPTENDQLGINCLNNANQTNYVFGNTIIGSGPYVILVEWNTVYFTNNIILSSGIGIDVFSPSGTVSWAFGDYNLAQQPLVTAGTHDVIGFPNFSNPGLGRYWLSSSVGGAFNGASGFGPVDFFNNSQSSVIDIGFVQYSDSLATDKRFLDPSTAVGANYWGPTNADPYMTALPQTAITSIGGNATFSVTAGGTTPITYQWLTNGVAITGATSSSYTYNNAQLSASGLRFSVVASNSVGTLASPGYGFTIGGLTYYAIPDPAGSTNNTGQTSDSPWPLTYALSTVQASNKIIVLDGTYAGSIYVGQPYTTLICNRPKGVHISGAVNEPCISIFPNPYGCVIDGFELSTSTSYGVSIYGPTNTIQNCWIHDCGRSGIKFGYPENNCSFNNNTIEGCGTLGLFDSGIYAPGFKNTIQGNSIRNNLGFGIEMFGSQSDQNKILNNILYGNSGLSTFTNYQIDIANSSSTGTSNYIYSNTIISTNDKTILLSDDTDYLSNNIIISTGLGVVSNSTAIVIQDYNMIPQAIAGTPGTHNVVSSNYGFKQGVDYNLLTVGSSARNSGVNLSAIFTTDFNGFTRPASGAWDIGAAQYIIPIYASVFKQ